MFGYVSFAMWQSSKNVEMRRVLSHSIAANYGEYFNITFQISCFCIFCCAAIWALSVVYWIFALSFVLLYACRVRYSTSFVLRPLFLSYLFCIARQLNLFLYIYIYILFSFSFDNFYYLYILFFSFIDFCINTIQLYLPFSARIILVECLF